jgi:AcrR family transcriptional regulator
MSTVPRTMRADAARNRERVLAAAAAVFAERGVDGSLPQVAARAGVGVATIYRSFPTKVDLIEALLADRFRAFADRVTDALGAGDPWEALLDVLHATAAAQVTDRVFGQVMSEAFSLPAVRAERERALEALQRLVARAQAAGAMRGDVVAEDVIVLLSGLAASPSALDRRGRSWERQLALAVDGLRAQGAHPLPRPPLSRRRLERLTAELRGALASCRRG